MKLQETTHPYHDETLAVEAFKEYRLSKGVQCKKCGSSRHYWLASKHQFQCVRCRFRTTLRSGTFLQASKLPYTYLFIAVNALVEKGDKLTLEEFQKQTGHKYYETLWDFFHKIKTQLGKEDRPLVLFYYQELLAKHFESNKVYQNLMVPLAQRREAVSINNPRSEV